MNFFWDDIIKSGLPIDHHESDLYIKYCPEAVRLVDHYKKSITIFRSQIDNELWIEIPFAYYPFWHKRGMK